jgi:hypothetical protein
MGFPQALIVVTSAHWCGLQTIFLLGSGMVHGGSWLGVVIALAAGAFAIAGCAQVQQRQQLAEPIGLVMRTPVGGTIATILKDRDLPNAWGRADIHGRKVDAGFTKIIYRGPDSDGSILVEQIDIDLKSNASTLTRPPVIYTRTQPAVTSSRESGAVYGSSRTVSIVSPSEQSAVALPSAAQFSVPKQRSLTLPTGQTVEFIAAERHELIFRIVEPGM